jgi:hypothetical protein
MRCGGPAVWVEPLQDPAIRGGRPCSSPCKPRRAGSLGLAISTQPRGRRCRGFSPVQRLSDRRVLGMLAVAAAFILAAAAPAPAAPAAAEAEDNPSTDERKRGTHFSLAADPSHSVRKAAKPWSQNFRWPVLVCAPPNRGCRTPLRRRHALPRAPWNRFRFTPDRRDREPARPALSRPAPPGARPS